MLPAAVGANSRPHIRQHVTLQPPAIRQGSHQRRPPTPVSGGAVSPPSPQQQVQRPQLYRSDELVSIEDLLEDLEAVDFVPLDERSAAAVVAAPSAPVGHISSQASSSSSSPALPGSDAPSDAASTSGSDGGDRRAGDDGWPADGGGRGRDGADSEDAAAPATEFVLRLERRGDGWAEEIFPHVVMEQRLVEKPRRDRPRSSQPDPWEEGSLELFMESMGLDRQQIDAAVQMATQWRVTEGGRPLLDRRRRSRVQRNVESITYHLLSVCGFTLGEVGQLLVETPHVLLCKPSHNDRFDRRVISLAAFRFRHGHVDVPEEWEVEPELVPWMRRMRVSRAQGSMSAERQQILESLGFEFGEVAQITDDWEMHFDQLVDWLVWADENSVSSPGWCGLDWGQGGPTAREVALWVQLQRELRRRGLLQPVAEQRLNAIGLAWQPQDGREEDRRWMSRVGRLLYAVERVRRKRSADVAALAAATAEFEETPLRFEDLLIGRVPLAPLQRKDLLTRRRPQPEGQHRKPGRPPLGRSGGAGVLTQEKVIAERRAALRLTKLESGLGYWLAKQRWLWRRNRLPQERFEMLQLAGVDMDCSSPSDWLASAHAAARFVTGGCCAASPPPPWPLPDLQQEKSLLDSATCAEAMNSSAPAQPPDTEAAVNTRASSNGSSPTSSGRVAQLPDLYGYPPPSTRRLPSATTGAVPAARDGALRRSRAPAAVASRPPPSQPLATAAADGCAQPSAVAVRRWVLTQKRLKETQDRDRELSGREAATRAPLSSGHIRYLQLLGVTWLLSSEVVSMRPSLWAAQYEALARMTHRTAAVGSSMPRAALRSWLAHQKGLHALGLLSQQQKSLLERLGVCWERPLTMSETRWAACFANLVAFTRRHGHSQVPKDIGALAQWRAHQMALWRAGKLPANRQLQLRALLGTEISASIAPAGSRSSPE